MTQLADLKKDWLEDPEFKVEYDALEFSYAVAQQLIAARVQAGLTQAEVAERMCTQKSEVSRIEAARHNISLSKLQSYAQAVGSSLDIRLRPL